jgi:hypothetical protein
MGATLLSETHSKNDFCSLYFVIFAPLARSTSPSLYLPGTRGAALSREDGDDDVMSWMLMHGDLFAPVDLPALGVGLSAAVPGASASAIADGGGGDFPFEMDGSAAGGGGGAPRSRSMTPTLERAWLAGVPLSPPQHGGVTPEASLAFAGATSPQRTLSFSGGGGGGGGGGAAAASSAASATQAQRLRSNSLGSYGSSGGGSAGLAGSVSAAVAAA